jgi:2Fe-2S ferredoxin
MVIIRLEPSGYEIPAQPGETLMEAARRAGYYWPTTCGGNGECTTCACTIVEGAANVSEMGRFESKSLLAGRGRSAVSQGLRLGCQTRVFGDIVVRKPGVRAPGE